jgi:hypothetical protein
MMSSRPGVSAARFLTTREVDTILRVSTETALRRFRISSTRSSSGTGRTVRTLRERLKRPLDDYGDILLVDLERMTDELAAFSSTLPDRYR